MTQRWVFWGAAFILSCEAVLTIATVDGMPERPCADCLYKFFPHPAYCGKMPLEAQQRQSPPLSEKDQRRSLKLQQVQFFIRHGMRTTDQVTQICWDGSPPQSWDCSVQVDVQGLFPGPRSQNGGVTSGSARQLKESFAFRKVYDALPHVNALNGTCQSGQLLAEGVRQHEFVGKLLAQAYLDVNSLAKIPAPHTPALVEPTTLKRDLYIQSTDMERTVLSVSTLITSAFRTAFPDWKPTEPLAVHTADYQWDFTAGNMHFCPAAMESYQRALQSQEYKTLLKKHHVYRERVQDAWNGKLTDDAWTEMVTDCVRSQLCAEAWTLLPKKLRPTTESDWTFYRAFLSALDKESIFPFLYNDAEYSKLKVSHTAKKIRDLIIRSIEQSHRAEEPSPKLYMWSGHDTTIGPLLASMQLISPTEFVPYASMVALEIFAEEQQQSGPLVHLFRLVFNGQVLTDRVDGCPKDEELCNVDYFFKATSWVEDAIRVCALSFARTHSKRESWRLRGSAVIRP